MALVGLPNGPHFKPIFCYSGVVKLVLQLIHSSKIKGFWLMNCSSEILEICVLKKYKNVLFLIHGKLNKVAQIKYNLNIGIRIPKFDNF